jgi:flagellar basal-body rod protein FlgG
MIGTGVHTVATEKLHTQGNIVQTGNSLDVAINGRGFLQVQLPDGATAYTRDGSMQVNSSGQLVTSNGYSVLPAITIPANAQSVAISPDGIVSVLTTGSTSPTQVGQLQLADFVNPTGLQPIGKNLYMESGSSGNAQTGNPQSNGLGSLTQGSVESSNVNVVEELVSMIETQRAYEMNSKAISTVASMLQYLNNNV